MNDDVRNIVLGVLATGISAALGWFTRTYLWRRRLRRKQAFFGLPDNSESLLVVNRDAGGTDLMVTRHDVFALLELSALIKDCNAHAQVVAHDSAQQGFGERTEFCWAGRSPTGGWPPICRVCCRGCGSTWTANRGRSGARSGSGASAT